MPKFGNGLGPENISSILPGVIALSILFGTTSLLAVTVTFEKKNCSLERLLLAPIPLELLMPAKTSGAILFGVVNAFVPILMAAFLVDLGHVNWLVFVPAIFLISVASTFLGLFIAVAVSEIFEARPFSNFFRFPMIFLYGLFFPISALPLTYGAGMLHGAIHGGNMLAVPIDMAFLATFCFGLYMVSLRNIRRRWIA